ncbi:hypothetical protein PACTADRAFT_48253 [Pachysolen tannophilus NRRL Y-2460]|uniref:Uncharacterized protein n=1 Tax=Pachysolen tannophilus NRRL Y-2460 TaxID=669874 RepID=A0A1E4U3M2_PACTA|nr:hypothetical protein PACTADRAFT_48253 [Pachysolen tannophilus NRRL Y-2460]
MYVVFPIFNKRYINKTVTVIVVVTCLSPNNQASYYYYVYDDQWYSHDSSHCTYKFDYSQLNALIIRQLAKCRYF